MMFFLGYNMAHISIAAMPELINNISEIYAFKTE